MKKETTPAASLGSTQVSVNQDGQHDRILKVTSKHLIWSLAACWIEHKPELKYFSRRIFQEMVYNYTLK